MAGSYRSISLSSVRGRFGRRKRVASAKPAANISPVAPQTPRPPGVYQQPDCKIFQLPGELRNIIYQYYLYSDFEPSDFVRTDNPSATFFEQQRGSLPAFMVTCRRAYGDTMGAASSVAAIKITWSGLNAVAEMAFHGRLQWANLRTLYLIIAMERRRFHCWSSFVYPVLASCVALRELVVEWHPSEEGEARTYHSIQMEDEITQLRDLVARKFLETIKQVQALRALEFRGNVPDTWVDFIQKDGRVRVTQSTL